MNNQFPDLFDVIVVGAGHAGCEAALAAARMGCRTLMLTIDLDKVAAMPCSPSIGGMAKGQLVKEIDALGGEMAKNADKTAAQYRTLNTKKGPAVRSTRTRNDKGLYHREMKSVLENTPGLTMRQAMVERLVIENGRVCGVEDLTGYVYTGHTVVMAAGTFFSGRVHIGLNSFEAGRAGEFASNGLPAHLRELGFDTGRMKTGTPPRIHRRSIDFSCFTEHLSDDCPIPFSFLNNKITHQQAPSYMGRTNEKSRMVIINNLKKSPLYSGKIQGVSARYCPSYEDKAVRFPDRTSHPVILEPEGFDSNEIYASGLGNSMPQEVQLEFVRSVRGLEEAEIIRPAYAIEYDYMNPVQLKPTLETKRVGGLFAAGQINGTSGYEEAGAQGLWAGINAACQVQKRPPFILDRSEAYIGVMIDDLVTRGTQEPYRMFTSRAEYRLLLREDNADLRLSEKGFELGLISKERIDELKDIKAQIEAETQRVKSAVVRPSEDVNAYLTELESPVIQTGVIMEQLLKRAQLTYDAVRKISPSDTPVGDKVARQVEINIKYEGYIDRQTLEIKRFKDMEIIQIPEDYNFTATHGLSNELKAKLSEIRPTSIGQASRIDGMTPAALSAIMINLKGHTGTDTNLGD